MESIVPVSDEELFQIDKMLADVHIAVSMSMAYIRKTQGWSFDQLGQRFSGISSSTWKRYLQPSYQKMRPLHVVAAYSWLTMVPMPSFYRGLAIKEAYRGMDSESVEAMIHCGILPRRQFRLALDHLYEYLSHDDKESISAFISEIRSKYGSLDDYANEDFLFPHSLDMELFSFDYYRSVAIAFREFREKNKLSAECVANVLNLSLYKYKQCENPDNPVPLPIDIAARLKLGFRLNDAMSFTSHMEHFPQFHTVRLVQHIRETKLVEFMKYIPAEHKQHFVAIIINMASIYTKSL